jgi:hypothetical protein
MNKYDGKVLKITPKEKINIDVYKIHNNENRDPMYVNETLSSDSTYTVHVFYVQEKNNKILLDVKFQNRDLALGLDIDDFNIQG